MADQTETKTEQGDAHSAQAGTKEDVSHGEVAHHEAEGGMPQFDPSSFPNQAFWLIISLVAIYIILSRIALPRIGGILETRAGTIQRDLDRAAELRNKAREAEENYQRALDEARAEAQMLADEARAKIDASIAEKTQAADAEIAKHSAKSAKKIEKMRADAEASIGKITQDVAESLVGQIAGQAKDKKMLTETVDKLLKG